MERSVWRDAVIDNGRHVMYEVTSRLYQGGLLRPDLYYQSKYGIGAYRRTFDRHQQAVIELSGESINYNIEEGAKHFDISLHWLVLQKLCRLKSSSRLHKNLSELVSLRNQVVHSTSYNKVDDLKEKLYYLAVLYDDILNELEDETGDNLSMARRKINEQVAPSSYSQVPSTITYNQPSTFSSNLSPSQRTEDDGLGTFGKVAVGVVGAIGIGLGLLAAFTSDKKDEPQRKNTTQRSERR